MNGSGVFSGTAASKTITQKYVNIKWYDYLESSMGKISLFPSSDGYDGVVDDFLCHMPASTTIASVWVLYFLIALSLLYLVTVSIFPIRPNSGLHYILLVSICLLLFFCCNRRSEEKKVKCGEDKWNSTVMVCGDGLAVPFFFIYVSYYLFYVLDFLVS